METQLSTTNCQFSSGISITGNHLVRVHSGQKHQILLMPVTIQVVLVIVSLRITNHFRESMPFIGLSMSNKPHDEFIIPYDPDLILWSLSERKIYWKGKIFYETRLSCNSECEIKISLSTIQQSLNLQVKSDTGDIQTEEIQIERLDCDTFWPVVGAISVGLNPVEFELLKMTSDVRNITPFVKFSSAGGNMVITEDGKRVSRTSKDSGNSVALLNQVISEGIHYWKFEVISDFGASIGIGLAMQNFQVSEKYRCDPLKHIYHHRGLHLWRSYRGLLYRNGHQQTGSLEHLGWHNDRTVIVEFTLNMSEGKLEIFKNGRSLGVAFRDIREPVQPAVAFYAAYEKDVRLLEFQSSSFFSRGVEPDRPVHVIRSDKVAFDPKSLQGKLMLTDDGMTLYRQREQSGNAYGLLNVTLISGVYRWSFVVQNDQGASTCVGVAKEPVTLNKTGNLYTSRDLYVLRSFQGMLYSEGQEIKKRCSEFWLSGSLIEVSFEVNSHNGVVSYAVNGEDQGIAFTNITPPLKPIVGFYAGMEKKITLVHFEHKPLELSPSSQLKASKNDLNTAGTNHSSKHNPLPIFVQCSELSVYCDTCLICDGTVDVVALPCKHSTLCANHLVFDSTQNCLVCDQTVSGVWNILSH
jgi:hypothetical protein